MPTNCKKHNNGYKKNEWPFIDFHSRCLVAKKARSAYLIAFGVQVVFDDKLQGDKLVRNSQYGQWMINYSFVPVKVSKTAAAIPNEEFVLAKRPF
jgi:hypothetical protein